MAIAIHCGRAGVEVTGYSDSVAERIEHAQAVAGDGPGFVAFGSGRPVRIACGPTGFEAWPMFAHAAGRLGVGAVSALPLRVGGIRIGAFTLYRYRPDELAVRVEADAMLLADAISYTLLEDLVRRTPGEVDLTTTYRDVNVAIGLVAAKLGIPLEWALLRLRAVAFAAERPLLEVAHDVLRRCAAVDERLADRPDAMPGGPKVP
ncbi:hypothetical protein [Nocardia nova]|uniref:hypothetical protein n=1 Tax=Nocardia nova TaxID=37330 RepID=UPI0011DD6684|nr:hypothetical protein [Nocardia nova]